MICCSNKKYKKFTSIRSSNNFDFDEQIDYKVKDCYLLQNEKTVLKIVLKI